MNPLSRFVYTCITLKCVLAATVIPSNKSYNWDWGNGFSETHRSNLVTNTWKLPGDYNITLTVLDSLGNKSVSTQLITITKPDTVVISTIKHDTIAYNFQYPNKILQGFYIDSTFKATDGYNLVAVSWIGRLFKKPDGTFDAYITSVSALGSSTYSINQMQFKGNYPDIYIAIRALNTP